MKGGVDKGFCLSYWRLSYRRKFLRTLWIVPWAVVAVALFFALNLSLFGIGAWGWAAVLAIGLPAQALYNYRKWQSEKQLVGDS